jgi:hypothetical protein
LTADYAEPATQVIRQAAVVAPTMSEKVGNERRIVDASAGVDRDRAGSPCALGRAAVRTIARALGPQQT